MVVSFSISSPLPAVCLLGLLNPPDCVSPKAHQPTEKMRPMLLLLLLLTHVAALFAPCLPTLDVTGHFISGAMSKDPISG